MTTHIPSKADDGVELVELLQLVAEVCTTFPVRMNAFLEFLLGSGYDAYALRADVNRLADGLAVDMGFANACEVIGQ